MKRFTLLFCVVGAVALLGNMAFGQESAGTPTEIIKELDGLVGKWQVEGKIGDKSQAGTYSCRWARTEDKRKVCLVGQFSYNTDGMERSGVNLIGWNAAKKCIEDRGFDGNGGNATLYWRLKSSTELDGEVIMVVNGKEVRSKEVLTKKGPSEIVVESKSETGQEARWVFRKVKAEEKKKSKQ